MTPDELTVTTPNGDPLTFVQMPATRAHAEGWGMRMPDGRDFPLASVERITSGQDGTYVVPKRGKRVRVGIGKMHGGVEWVMFWPASRVPS